MAEVGPKGGGMLKGFAFRDLDVEKAEGVVTQALRGSWLQLGACVPGQECYTDQVHLMMLLVLLCLTIGSMLCAFGFFREDKDEMFTPLTPQLVVKKEAQLKMRFPFDSQEESFDILRLDGEILCRVASEWPESSDPFRDGGSAGVLGSFKIQSAKGNTIAVVRARQHSAMGQSLQLCRPSVHEYMTDMFAFVEPEGENRFCIRHRTGYPLLILQGTFSGSGIHVEGRNKDHALICELKKVDDHLECSVLQYVDAGLVIGGLLAILLQNRMVERTAQVSEETVSSERGPSPETLEAGMPGVEVPQFSGEAPSALESG